MRQMLATSIPHATNLLSTIALSTRTSTGAQYGHLLRRQHSIQFQVFSIKQTFSPLHNRLIFENCYFLGCVKTGYFENYSGGGYIQDVNPYMTTPTAYSAQIDSLTSQLSEGNRVIMIYNLLYDLNSKFFYVKLQQIQPLKRERERLK